MISRAEPANLLVETLKSYFGGEGKSTGAQSETRVTVADAAFSSDPFLPALQSVAGNFTALRSMGIASLTLSLEVGCDPVRLYLFTTLTGIVEPLAEEGMNQADVKVRAVNAEQFFHAVHTNDLSLIEIVHSLF